MENPNAMDMIRIRNLSEIWKYMCSRVEARVADIAKGTGIGLTTVKKYVEQACVCRMLLTGDSYVCTGGRRAAQYAINRAYQYFLFLAVDNDVLHYRVLDFSASPVKEGSERFETQHYLSAVQNITDGVKRDFPSLGTICLSVPCVVKSGRITDWYRLSALNGFDIKEYLSEKYKTNVIVQNNMKIASLGIISRCGSDKPTLASLQFGHDGIGAALAYDGEIIEGRDGFAGEIGFLSHDREDITNRAFLINTVNAIIVFLNPEKIIFYRSGVPNDFDGIFAEAVKSLPDYAVPAYEISDSFLEDMYSGLKESIDRLGYFERTDIEE